MQGRSWRAVVLAVVIVAWEGRSACAGPVQYQWAPMAGYGRYLTYPFGPSGGYVSFDGYLRITYDPDNLANDRVLAFVGDPINEFIAVGGDGVAGTLSIKLLGNELTFSGLNIAGSIGVTLTGDPGPLTPGGLPENLDGFLGQGAQVNESTAGHAPIEFSFLGVAGAGAPEPSSLILLATALPLVACALRRRGRVGR